MPHLAQRYEAAERRVEGLTRDEACRRYQRKVLLLARRVHERLSAEAGVTVDDLISCGAIGLLEAFDRYDGARGIGFSTFAEYRIRGAMYDALRTNDTFTRRRRQLAKVVAEATETLRKDLHRNPTPEEVAERLGIDLEQYWDAVDRTKPITHVSLEGTTGDDERPLVEILMDRSAPDADLALQMAEVRQHLRDAIASLPDKPRNCILMYYGKDMSLAEIAEVYEVTVSRVSQILTEAREKLRKKLLAVVDPADLALEAGK